MERLPPGFRPRRASVTRTALCRVTRAKQLGVRRFKTRRRHARAALRAVRALMMPRGRCIDFSSAAGHGRPTCRACWPSGEAFDLQCWRRYRNSASCGHSDQATDTSIRDVRLRRQRWLSTGLLENPSLVAAMLLMVVRQPPARNIQCRD